MKLSGYELFDQYDAAKFGTPRLGTGSADIDAVKQRVYAKTGVQPKAHKKRFVLTRWIAGITAVLFAAMGSITVYSAAAGYDGVGAFFRSIFTQEVPQNPEKLEGLVLTPEVTFDSTNEDVTFTLLGMYGDQSQTMLSFAIRRSGDAALAAGVTSPLVEYAAVDESGVSEVLSYAGQTCTIYADKSDPDLFYLNLFLTQPDLQGKTLDITFRNFYTNDTCVQIQNDIIAMQEQWQRDYVEQTYGEAGLEALDRGELPREFEVNTWEAFWQQQDYDRLTDEKYSVLFQEAQPAVEGTWHAEITLDFPVAEPIATTYGDEVKICLQTLSTQITYPSAWSDADHLVMFELALKDGRKIFIDETSKMEQEDAETVKCGLYGWYSEDRTRLTDMICYEEPIEPSEIAEIVMTRCTYDYDQSDPDVQGQKITDVIYTAS